MAPVHVCTPQTLSPNAQHLCLLSLFGRLDTYNPYCSHIWLVNVMRLKQSHSSHHTPLCSDREIRLLFIRLYYWIISGYTLPYYTMLCMSPYISGYWIISVWCILYHTMLCISPYTSGYWIISLWCLLYHIGAIHVYHSLHTRLLNHFSVVSTVSYQVMYQSHSSGSSMFHRREASGVPPTRTPNLWGVST